ncbi:MAG: hypothetical protein GY832_05060 [Chloroflexi bacterium]|nr:hypothetical protein [Chloroflexota bacterium]
MLTHCRAKIDRQSPQQGQPVSISHPSPLVVTDNASHRFFPTAPSPRKQANTASGQTRERRQGSGVNHTVVAQQERIDVHLAALDVSALANGRTWMDNEATLYLDGASATDSALMTDRRRRTYVL